MASRTYDLIVIGSGPAGEKGAAQAAYFEKSVALIEREPPPVLGGAAANTGTLPSKTLRETAVFLSGFRNRELEGLDVRQKGEIDIQSFMGREQVVVRNERERIRKNLERHNVDVYTGAASFVAHDTVAVHNPGRPEILLRGRYFLIATGSTPYRPPVFRVDDPRVRDSDSILKLQAIPKSLLVIGGGIIGCEYACIFAILGVKVTLVERYERLIGLLDAELSETLRQEMVKLGIVFHMPDVVEDVQYGTAIDIRLKSGTLLRADTVLVSSGRNGNIRDLGLERIGVAITPERSLIEVNRETYQTSVPNVYAAGDVIGNPALASTAMEQARVAMVHAFNLQYKKAVAQILPSGIYTIPECSMAGETEESLQKKGIPYIVGKATYVSNARGQIIGDDDGFLKLLFHEEEMRLLGVHVIGEQATEIVHVGLTALLVGATANLFIDTCYNYPTLTELYKYATYDALGRLARKGAGK